MNTECEVMNIFSFDGQTVWLDRDTAVFEVGNFLGGGAAGNVYECEHVATQQLYALKILNPIGYKILSPALLRKCNVLVKGKVFNDTDKSGGVLKPDNIWWLLSSSNKQYIAGYFSEKYNSLKELSLNQCIQLWGTELPGVADEESEGGVNLTPLTGAVKTYVPNYPPKFVDFIRRRNRIFREIKNMRKISNHKNVILLESVLELIQESKCTIFLVMELANGGELFDRIKLDCGAREDTANAFFQQLLLGVKHCHDQGVCHRDLKPENLLLQDNTTETVLKIADFGFSARFAMSFDDSGRGVKDSNPAFASSFDDSGSAVHAGSVHTPSSSFLDESPLRVLKSVVGSPFYVAPEVMQAHGYDGCKADVWSLGVILYAMLAGNLPFSQELSICKRFRHFCKWVREESVRVNSFLENVDAIEFPQWLFPARFSNRAKGLIVSMLHPDPDRRITVADAMNFPLCLDGSKPPSDSSHAKGPSVVPEGIAEIADNNANNNNDDYDEDADEEAMQVDSRVDSVEDGQMFEMEEDKCVVETRERPPMPVAKKLTFSDESAGVLQQQQQQQAAAARKEKVSSGVSMPPLARLSIVPLKDLINVNSADDDESPFYDSPISGNRDRDGGDESTTPRNRNNGGQPPNFNDLVKRSTRFITAVPAAMVLDKIETILEKVKFQRIATAIGFIGKVELNWDRFCLEVWGLETHGPPLCSLYIYQLQPNDVPNTSASALYSSPHTGAGYATEQQPLHLVEFVRGQLEIFAFKRFYEWVRQELSELVKRDYSLKFFDQASSPVVGGLYFPKR